jgi:hypothetical protein
VITITPSCSLFAKSSVAQSDVTQILCQAEFSAILLPAREASVGEGDRAPKSAWWRRLSGSLRKLMNAGAAA